MAKITSYYEKKRLIDQLSEELNKLEEDQALKSELAFKDDVKSLMDEHGRTPADVIEIMLAIDPDSAANVPEKQVAPNGKRAPASRTPKTRKMLIFKNPNTGEVVETRGANHKTLNDWRLQYGRETVKEWQQN